MRFLPARSAPIGRPDILFRESGGRTLVFSACATLAGVVASLVAAYVRGSFPWKVFYGVALVCFFFAAVGFASFWRTRDPSNWLCQVRGDKMWLRCSRFWSNRDSDDVRVLELNRDEIAWMQPLKVHSTVDERLPKAKWNSRPSGGIVHRYNTYLDIGLSANGIASLQVLIDGRSIDGIARELLAPGGNIREQPVQLMDDSSICLRWGDPISNITPRIEAAAKFFSQWTEVRPLRRETVHSY